MTVVRPFAAKCLDAVGTPVPVRQVINAVPVNSVLCGCDGSGNSACLAYFFWCVQFSVRLWGLKLLLVLRRHDTCALIVPIVITIHTAAGLLTLTTAVRRPEG